jgi:hypothetical protein
LQEHVSSFHPREHSALSVRSSGKLKYALSFQAMLVTQVVSPFTRWSVGTKHIIDGSWFTHRNSLATQETSTLMSSSLIDFSSFTGIHSTGAAILFTALYVPPLLFFIWKAIRQFTFVYVAAAIFSVGKTYSNIPLSSCPQLILASLVRIATFSVRAYIASSDKAKGETGINIAYGVLFAAGFSALLYSAYTLILDR